MSSLKDMQESLRQGISVSFPEHFESLEYARSLDAQDELSSFRDEFLIPSKTSLCKTALDGSLPDQNDPCIYFVGNSLGAQPKAVRAHLDAHLETWASIGVNGHFTSLSDSPLPPWQDLAESCAALSVDIVGAAADEIILMNSLTANLHLLLASFYRPTADRYKIIMEWKPFPSDFYAVESQISWHGRDPKDAMVLIQPDDDGSGNGAIISTESILSVIDNTPDAALLLLPGIQYYSGQFFDMPRITAHARARGLVVGWDLAHAVGNVELRLHDWDVDFAVWCTYKYLNAGPGAIGGAFVHARHGGTQNSETFRPRLAGWYGGDKSVRFNMDNVFVPTPGAAGFQLSNPPAGDLAVAKAALGVVQRAGLRRMRDKSLVMTAYAERLLAEVLRRGAGDEFTVLTPRDARERGAQLSVRFKEGLMAGVAERLLEGGVVCDQRKPDVIRVAPIPLYTTFADVHRFMEILGDALNGKK
ncbi:hypothetical protein TD95_001035 [Thielaviopsis punctulata]|uniref:Kynureninase n=1 Tax=Thielaviopsis punctulata TaxID=72032 RepID=A0A0F4ZJI6_9PEZI|nr:hypothetical protein TD95_001035 [Thielaviopsis punctulata]